MTDRATCPSCDGVGEVFFNEEQNEWGVWDRDSEACLLCQGRGSVAVPLDPPT